MNIHNPTKESRVFHERGGRVRVVNPGQTVRNVDLHEIYLARTSLRLSGLTINKANVYDYAEPIPAPITDKEPLVIEGMWGIGDNLHQRALIRKLLVQYDVWLRTCHAELYHDLVKQGLKLVRKQTSLWAQRKTLEREARLFTGFPIPPDSAILKRIWYHQPEIEKFGSIVECMIGACGLDTADLDFSLPIKPEWRESLSKKVDFAKLRPDGKRLMVYRPTVLRREWNSQSRNPDAVAYETIYKSIRNEFYVVSVADLSAGREWIVGHEPDVDLRFHAGELTFPEMAALWAEADLSFCNAGFGPVLAQSVGTPGIVVYGGRESFRTTERAGQHLAPTLGIDPITPCDCHQERHSCMQTKAIDVEKALKRVRAFVDGLPQTRAPQMIAGGKNAVLIFATTYEDCPERAKLTDHWINLHGRLNPNCDLMLVDSASPYRPSIAERHPEFTRYKPGMTARRMLHDFGDNIGHLARKGRDGWGRAFCFGLQAAIEGHYNYVVHVEGDSLTRLDVASVCADMKQHPDRKADCYTTIVKGMKADHRNWVETGLMFFDVDYLSKSNFIARYNWRVRQSAPTPEVVIFNLISKDTTFKDWKALRGDKNQITHQNVVALDLDWVTHCHTDAWVYDRYIEAQTTTNVMPVVSKTIDAIPVVLPSPGLNLNLGCGTNKLKGWDNHDADVDITKRLPWPDGSAAFIFCEHCVEHVDYYAAIEFFKECRRVLRPDGVLRIATPSIEKIMNCANDAYFQFTQKWQDVGPTARGAMHAILYAHGHKTAWTDSLLAATLYFCGFDEVNKRDVGNSPHQKLKDVEGHAKVIGGLFNDIETIVYEGRCIASAVKAIEPIEPVVPSSRERVAILVGGAEEWRDELERAKALCTEAGCPYVLFVCNDSIPEVSDDVEYAVTLHPDKMTTWLNTRKGNHYPAPSQLWGHRKSANIPNATDDWGGSSGLFMAKLAMERGFKKIILAGIPMNPTQKHFVRHIHWGAAPAFWRAWERRAPELRPFTRGLSGKTKDLLGVATVEWLNG